MTPSWRPPAFWLNWLKLASLLTALFGLVPVLAPALTRAAFSLLIYASPERLDAQSAAQVQYVSLTHAVMGALMIGLGAAFFYAAKYLVAEGNRHGWNLIALSLGLWFIPDTAYSLVSGFWQNAVLNLLTLGMFVPALWKTRPA